MKINTDLIKNKKYTTPIKSSILKHSQEYRVLATLRYLNPGKFNTMTIGETPDLQDLINDLGIEVTVATNENDMKASRAFSELYQETPKDIEMRERVIESSGYSFTSLRGKKIAITRSGTADGEKYFFQESVRRKTKKLWQYRAKYKTIGLAILLTEIPTSYAEKHFIEWFSECLEKTNSIFDFVYVISCRFCIYYDVQKKVTEKYFLTDKESQLLSVIGRMTAEGELSLADFEWL